MKRLLLLLVIWTFSMLVKAQLKIGENTTTLNSSALLEIESNQSTGNAKGLLLPRVPLNGVFDSITIPQPAVGLMVYAKGGILPSGIYSWNGSQWKTSILPSNIDTTNDEWVNSVIDSSIKLKNNSNANVRSLGSDFVIKDNGSVGIGTNTPNKGAILDLSSNNRGILLPRIALQAANIWSLEGNPTNGMIVFNTVNSGISQNKVYANTYYYWSDSTWKLLTSNNNPLTTIVTTGGQAAAVSGTFPANTQCYCGAACEQNLNIEKSFTVYKNNNSVDVMANAQVVLYGSASDATLCAKIYNSSGVVVASGGIYMNYQGINGCMGNSFYGKPVIVNNLPAGDYNVKLTLSLRNYSPNTLHWAVGKAIDAYPSCGGNTLNNQNISISVTE